MAKKFVLGIIASVLFFSLTPFASAAAPAYKEGQLLVKFSDVGGQAMPRLMKTAVLNSALSGAMVLKEYSIVKGLALVKLPSGVTVSNAVSTLQNSTNIVYAEPDYTYQIAATFPNDARFGELWGMNNTGQSGGTIDADIDAPEAWGIGTGDANVVVAVMDSGVDYAHPDLSANMWVNTAEKNGAAGVDDDGNGYVDDIYGYDFYNGDGDPMDDHGHGTHCSGTIGGRGNNSIGVAGVCWKVRIMALKIGSASGISTSAAISALQYAIQMKANISSNSWGGYGYSQSLKTAIEAAGSAGILFVAAAGNETNDNDGSFPAYPASYTSENIIAVMSTTRNDAISSFSNYGKTSVDLAAPGSDILSCEAGTNGYVTMSGTSMACPHVAGACALIKSVNPELTAAQIKAILLQKVDAKSALTNKCVSGGRLNLYAAVYEAKKDITAPSPNPMQWEITPTATGVQTITMEAVKATDISGVEYKFDCVNDVNFSSAWQSSPIYTKNGFDANTTYEFKVKARDKSTALNNTTYSDVNSTTTAATVDDLPPAPTPSQWLTRPTTVRPTTPPQLQMSAKIALDESSPVQYYFECVDNGINSGWRTSNVYAISNNPSFVIGTTYTFRFKTKDALGNESDWSSLSSVTPSLSGSGSGTNLLTVPRPYATIQDALDEANDGDVIEVRSGTYGGAGNRDLDFDGKSVLLRSSDPSNDAIVAATIINCGGTGSGLPMNSHRAFNFHSGEDANSIVSGFTIRNGYVRIDGDAGVGAGQAGEDAADAFGGAVYCEGSSPTIKLCVIENCVADGGVGGAGADGNEAVPGADGGKGGV